MSDPRIPRIVYLLLLIIGLLQIAHIYPELPARVASHFDANGNPNGWAPKEGFLILTFMIVGIPAVILFAGPNLAKIKRPERINLPNKDYWLAPEHAEETQRFFRTQMSWFACGVLFVLLYGTSQAMNANLPGAHFDSTKMFRVISAFVAFAILWTILTIRHFSHVPDATR
jgi:uncharacterized membrane protein